jgi:hypothetical protein
MINVSIKSAKSNFFDRKSVMGAVDAATRKVLSKFGSFVRKRAKTSIRKKKGTSKPGSPPYSQLGYLRQFLFFSYDRPRSSVVIGPARLNDTSDPGALPRLEYGGTMQGNGRVIFVSREVGRHKKGKFVSGGKDRVVLEGTITYKPRPFMGPALQAELPKLPAMWRDSVK